MASSISSAPGFEQLAREDPWPLVRSTGSWKLWLVMVALLAVVQWIGPGILVSLAHRSSDAGGARLEMFESTTAVRPAALIAKAPNTAGIPLPLPQTQLLLTACWYVKESGTHRFEFQCNDWGHVAVDGKDVVSLPRDVRGGVSREAELDLDEGWHLLSIQAVNLLKKGEMALRVAAPGEKSASPLGGETLRGCSPLWVSVLATLKSLNRVLLCCLAVALSLLLLSRFVSREACAVIGTCCLVFVPCVSFTRRATKEPLAHPEWNEVLKTRKPDWIFVGNSMMPCRIDTGRLRELTGGEAHVMRLPGTRTAAWYLALKNHVVASGVRPRATFLFFRDHWLTLPRLKASSQRSVLEGLSPGEEFNEPLIEELAFGDAAFRRGVGDLLEWVFPAMSWHNTMHHLPSEQAVKWTLAQADWQDGEQGDISRGKRAMDLRGALNNRFALGRLKGQEELAGEPINLGMGARDRSMLESDEAFSFERMNPHSFLPEFVRLSREHDLNLVLVRLRRRPVDNNRPEVDPRLEPYLDKLAEWLEGEGVPYFDFTDEESLALDWYGQGDHIATTHTTRYTDLFFKRLKTVFEGGR